MWLRKKFLIIKKMISRFRHAMRGFRVGAKEDRSIRLHLIVALFVFFAGFVVRLGLMEWTIVTLTIFIVITTEFVNSSIETFANHIHPDQHLAIKKTKDLAAAAVLVSSICALLIGILIFIPAIARLDCSNCKLNRSVSVFDRVGQ